MFDPIGDMVPTVALPVEVMVPWPHRFPSVLDTSAILTRTLRANPINRPAHRTDVASKRLGHLGGRPSLI